MTRVLVAAAIIAAAFVQPSGGKPIQPACEQPPSISGTAIPADVTCNDAAEFSDYSWRAFLAVTRRARLSARGVADPAVGVSDARAPRVFETYKAQWELFKASPASWQAQPSSPPCSTAALKPGDLVLASDKMDDVLQMIGDKTISGPLVAQNRTYIRYGVGFNQTAYEAIVKKRWNLTKGLGAPNNTSAMPHGSVVTKSAWMIVTPATAHPEKYYRRKAWVRRIPATGKQCDHVDVALIALHVIQKTEHSPQWIWTTFEHIDNVPMRRNEPKREGPFALHDNSKPALKMSPPNPMLNESLIAAPPAMNVVSDLPLSDETMSANADYRRLLAKAGAIWQHYQLVMTQWPRDLKQPQLGGGPALSIPGANNASSATYANPAIETHFQTPIENGCMSCHDTTRKVSDFLWTPVILARDDGADQASRLKRDQVMRVLLERLKSGGR